MEGTRGQRHHSGWLIGNTLKAHRSASWQHSGRGEEQRRRGGGKTEWENDKPAHLLIFRRWRSLVNTCIFALSFSSDSCHFPLFCLVHTLTHTFCFPSPTPPLLFSLFNHHTYILRSIFFLPLISATPSSQCRSLPAFSLWSQLTCCGNFVDAQIEGSAPSTCCNMPTRASNRKDGLSQSIISFWSSQAYSVWETCDMLCWRNVKNVLECSILK